MKILSHSNCSTNSLLAKLAVTLSCLSCLVGRALSFTASGQQQRRLGVRTGTDNVLYQFKKSTLLRATSEDVCTIQILMSDTGGGHRASANALSDAFEVLYPGKIRCDIVDIYTDYGPVWPYNDYVALYKLMAADPWIWDAFYQFGSTDFGLCVNEFLMENICFDAFTECLNRPSGDTGRRADMVISVHPLTQELPLKILSKLDSGTRQMSERKTPFCTVVTDLGSAHPTWFNPGVDKCFVPSDALNDAAQRRGVKPSQIVQHGLPIRKGFWATESGSVADDKKSMREKLGLDANLPVVLVVGGGDGMGGLVDISKSLGKELGKSVSKSQMIVVCGNNKEAKQQLDGVTWGDGVQVNVQGFVNNMDEWMKASDALVTKAGPGTIAEASICGLPCMMFSFLPGQEEGNIPFVEDAGFGKYSGEPSEIASIVNSWLSSPEKLEAMQTAALAAARPQATLDIAKDIGEMLFQHKHVQLASIALNKA